MKHKQAILLLLTSVCLTSACSSGPGISGSDLGRQVGELEHNTDPSTMICEDVKTIKAGAISDCNDGSSLTYRVTFDDSQGHFHVDIS